MIASVACRLQVSPREVRSMLWVDFREVIRNMGGTVRKTPQELQREIERMIHRG